MKKQPGIKKAKQVYRLADGRAVPGVTTILGVINKPHLVGWANKLGLDGYSVSDYVGEMAKIGTLVHGIIECMVVGKIPDISDFTPNQLETAQHALRSFWHWGSVHKVEFLDSEIRLVSEEYEYGGTIDCICMIDDVKTLLDFKTSGDIYPEHLIQVSAYKELAEENGIKVDQVGILRIGRGPDGGISEHYVNDTHTYLATFHVCRQLYGLLKEVKGKGMNGGSYNDT